MPPSGEGVDTNHRRAVREARTEVHRCAEKGTVHPVKGRSHAPRKQRHSQVSDNKEKLCDMLARGGTGGLV